MIHTAIEMPAARPSGEGLIIEAFRCWRRARLAGLAAAPRLYRLLAPSRRPMLAPTLDSLMRLFEDSLGRPPALGTTGLSADEALLLDLLDTAADIATPFGSALRSTRVMLGEGV